MTNPYYNPSGNPEAAAKGLSALMRAEFASIGTAFTLLTAAEALLAPLASPTFTGNPTAPTPAVGDNTAQLATTAFVLGQASSAAPRSNGTAAAGTATAWSRADHVHPADPVETFVFAQGAPMETWTITHQLNRFPDVTVVDSSGRIIEGDTVYNSAFQITLSFAGAFAGVAYLN